MLLDRSFGNGKNHFVGSDFVFQAIALKICVQFNRYGESPLLFCLLLNDIQTISAGVPDDIVQSQFLCNVRDPDSQIGFNHKRRCDRGFGSWLRNPFCIVWMISVNCSCVSATVFLFIGSTPFLFLIPAKVRIFGGKSSYF